MDWFIDPDRLDFFLSIEVTPGGLFLSQSKYISNLLEQSKMINANGSITPMLSSSTLSASNANPMEKSHRYRNIFGAMQYATITRLDIVLEVTPIGTITLNDFFLSIEGTPNHTGGLFLSQSKYISNLLEQSKMINAKTPMLSSSTLSASNADPMEKSHQYRNIFGAMQYATITRLDIAFSVNTVSRQLMYNPLDTHQKAVTRILSYLKLTLHMDYSRGNLKT